jgi:hypothetical protein
MSSIEQLLGPAARTIKEFYANHDGVLMYEDSVSSHWSGGEFKAAGIAFFPVGDWRRKSNEMRETLLEIFNSAAATPAWLLQGIAFGEICHCANYFVIQPKGEDAGKIFYAEHDGFDTHSVAGSFGGFLDSILAGPAEFLYRYGCYTRYSDGKSNIQWIPKEHVASVGT